MFPVRQKTPVPKGRARYGSRYHPNFCLHTHGNVSEHSFPFQKSIPRRQTLSCLTRTHVISYCLCPRACSTLSHALLTDHKPIQRCSSGGKFRIILNQRRLTAGGPLSLLEKQPLKNVYETRSHAIFAFLYIFLYLYARMNSTT